MKLSQSIIKIREENNLTQDAIADILNVTRQTISNWENDKSYPDLEMLCIISEKFNVSLDTLLKDNKAVISNINKKIRMNRLLKIFAIFLIVLLVIFSVFKIKENLRVKEENKQFNRTLLRIKNLGFKNNGIGFAELVENDVTYRIYIKDKLSIKEKFMTVSTKWNDSSAIVFTYDKNNQIQTDYLNENVTIYLDKTGKEINSKQDKKLNDVYLKYKDQTDPIIKRMMELHSESFKE